MSDVRPAGSIYDLGYRRYEGARLGRSHAVWTLFLYSLRAVFGMGRSFWAKLAAFGLVGIALLPAIVQLGIAAISPADLEIVTPEEYYEIIQVVLAIFCAIVAPELTTQDQRTNTLPLYFSRPIHRDDYAIAKFSALAAGMLALTLVPQLLMFTGNAAAAEDGLDYLGDNWQDLPAIVASALLLSCLVAAVGLAIASQTPQRAYSTIAVLAAFLLVSGIAASVFEAAEEGIGPLALLVSPFHIVRGFTFWMFDATPGVGSQIERADLPGVAYFGAALSFTAIGLAVLLNRYRTLAP